MPLMLLLSIAFISRSITSQAAPPTSPKEIVVPLKVQPMAAPKPALRYSLLPQLKEMTPGNPVMGYYQCQLDQDFSEEKESLNPRALRLANRAARMDQLNWQIQLPSGEVNGLAGPEVRSLLVLAKALRTQLLAQVADKHFGEAVETAKTLFALSRHLSEHPTLLGNLVGAAVASITLDSLLEMVQQPACPNLFWALTTLPTHQVSIDRSLQGILAEFQNNFKDLDQTQPMTPGQLQQLVLHLGGMNATAEQGPAKIIRLLLHFRANNPELLIAARRRLLESGIPAEQLRTLPAWQLILLDEKLTFDVYRDEFMKLMTLPYWQIEEQVATREPTRGSPLLAFGFQMENLLRYRRDVAFAEQKFAFLRHVEALRLYAAEHRGQLPEKLTDLAVPLPVDPLSGQPFRYSREGNVAHLRGSSPPHSLQYRALNRHYEITMAPFLEAK